MRLGWTALALSLAAAGQPPGCGDCHDQAKALKTSAHAAVACLQCHPRRQVSPHPEGLKTKECGSCHAAVLAEQRRSVHAEALRQGNPAAPNCEFCHGSAHQVKPARSAEFHQGVPELCGGCHSEPHEQFRDSVHGRAAARGVREAPVCTSCHGEHAIQRRTARESLVYHRRIPETCGQCHANVRLNRKFGLPEDRLVSFEESFHGLAAKAGSQTVANCASCHGAHDILPSSDPKSRIHPRNLAATCGRCHPGAGRRFALGPIHQVGGRGEARAVTWVRVSYQILIPLTIGLMLLHNLGDWVRKALRRFRAGAAEQVWGFSLRMLPLERLQHGLLAGSFLVLVWTGFALKYPEQWWARPLVRWESAFPLRGTLHRVAAVVLMGTAVLHILTLIFSPPLRQRWQQLWPRRADLAEGLARLAYNLGLTDRRRLISEHSYAEKAEYWAVVWGTAIMAVSGVILWATDWALAYLPKVVIDLAATVHFYEAVLAGLAILVWHFYWVIFDPEVYPMDTAWLTGYSSRPRRSTAREAPAAHRAAEEAPQPDVVPQRDSETVHDSHE